MRTHPFRPNLVLVLACLLALLLFLLGAASAATNFWGRFLIPIVLVFLWGRRRDIYIVTALASILVIGGYWAEGAAGFGDLLPNHLLPVFVTWCIAWLLARYKQMQEQIAHHKRELEEQVKTRTAELAASEQKWHSVFKFLPLGVSVVDNRNQVTESNPALAQILAMTTDHILQGQYAKRRYLRPDLSPMPPEEFPSARALREGQVVRDVTIGVEKEDGELIWVSVSATPQSIDGYALTVTADITAQKRAEQALRNSEAWYRLLVDNAEDVIWTVDLEGRFAFVNPAVEHQLGYRPQEVIGQRFDRWLTPASAAAAMAMFAAAAAQVRAGQRPEIPQFEGEQIRKDGTQISTQTVGVPLLDEAGRPLGFQGITRDVTERQRLAAAVRESERRYRMLADNMSDFIMTRNLKGEFTYFSPSCDRLGLRDKVEAIRANRPVDGFDAQQQAAAHTRLDRYHAAMAAGQPLPTEHYELRLSDTGGAVHWVEWVTTSMVDEVGELSGFISTGRDITERKQLEDALVTSERKYRDLYDNSPDMYFVGVPAHGLILECNQTLARTLGYAAEELIGGPSNVLFTPASYVQMQTTSGELLAAGRTDNFEVQLRHRDGTLLDALMSATIELSPAGGPARARVTLHDITERKRAEAERLALVDRWNMAAQISSIGVWDWRAGSDEVLWDERMYLLHGLAPGTAMTFAAWRALIHDDDRAAVVASSFKSARERTPAPVEYRVVLPDGSLRHLLSIGGGVYDDAGTPVRQLGITVDITEHKRLEAAVAVSEAQLRAIIENTEDTIWSVDGSYCLITGNSAFARSVAQQIGGQLAPGDCVFDAPFRPSERAFWQPLYDCALAGESLVIEMPAVVPAGGTLACYMNPICAADGTITGATARVTDITALKQAEAQLRTAYQRVRLAADAANIGIWTWNFADDILEWDDRMCELYGLADSARKNPLYYDVWRSHLHPDDRDAAEATFAAALKDGAPVLIQFRIVLPDGTVRHIQAASVIDHDHNGAPQRMIGINRDITDQKMYEQLLYDTNAVLEQRVAERTAQLRSAVTNLRRANQLRDEFMAMISHELRTPLTGVLSLSEMLEEQIAGPLNARQVAYVKGIITSGERLLAVINGILSYTHLLSGKVELHTEPCDLAYLLDICASSQRHKAAEKRQSIAVQVTPPDLTIITDGNALAEVLKRLLDNAVKFTPEGGRIGLEAHPGIVPATVDLVVWDTGIGIAPDQQEHVFHAFIQADARLSRSHEGIGLGLAYADEMVRLLGGTVSVESTLGEGSRFTVTLPAQR